MSCGPKGISRMLVRIGFGLSLLFVGIAHARTLQEFAQSVGQGFQNSILVNLGVVWGYALPFLMIIGGLSLLFKVLTKVGAWTAGLALLSIPAGLMLKSAEGGVSLADTMPAAMNAWVWVIIYMFAMKSAGSCGKACPCPPGANCSCDNMMPGMKSAASAPAAAKSVPAKKPVAKKIIAKK